MTARVVRISIAPVKSLGLVHPDEALLEQRGVAGDRRFWLRDGSGALYGGKRDGDLLRIRPAWSETTRSSRSRSPTVRARRASSSWASRSKPSCTGCLDLRGTCSVRGRKSSPCFVGRPLTLLWADEGAVDRTPQDGAVSLVSQASLERLGREAQTEDPVDGRRFRMLFEIDGVAAHEEDEWIGREVRIGDATVAFNGDVGRCVVTSREPDTGAIDLPTLAALARYRPEGRSEPLPFGIYGSAVAPGRVRVGDAVSPSAGAPAAGAGAQVCRRMSADPEDFVAFVEIPMGSRNKYEWDDELGGIVLDRRLLHLD